MPTILDMADVEPPDNIDGQSLLPQMQGSAQLSRPYLHIETAPTYQCLTDGREKFIWYVADGREEFFDLVTDPSEKRNLIASRDHTDRAKWWRSELVSVLAERPEEFTNGQNLIPGRPYPSLAQRLIA